jgi:signal transduction histidine kinase
MAAAERAFAHEGTQALEYELEMPGGPRQYEGRIAAAGNDQFILIVREITERKEQQRELERSRQRIVDAQDDARRRLERNLHDGAQQRLVSLSLSLRLAQQQLRSAPDTADELLSSSREELMQALEELRELARGIHPAVLTHRGLPEALEALANRSPLTIELDTPEERLPRQVEAAAYYVVSEALANVTKYAEARRVRVHVSQLNGNALVEVADDGVGGADPARGSGLRGLADRLSALNGTLVVESPPGEGTCIRAEIPIEVGWNE